MPIHSEIVGRLGETIVQNIDARWTMAYSACLGDLGSAYLDTRARPDVLAHPLFPVCVEWPLFLNPESMPSDLPAEERVRGVHFTHDLTLHRPIRAGMELTTQATMAQVETRRAGAYQLVRLETTTREGSPVATTFYGMMLRGVEVLGGDRALADIGPKAEPMPAGVAPTEFSISVPANAALVYTECARIWNPIHTDAMVAESAGLPEPILHGTATLAMAVSRIVAERLDGESQHVVRIGARFGAMVRMPSTLTLSMGPLVDDRIHFEVLESEGGRAIRDGLLVVG